MIPKTIHYCWFGGNPIPPELQRCIDSWHKYCPDYEIIRWDESNYNVSAIEYAKEAYEAGFYAFVSDVARLLIVYERGGIYMDTDVELIKPLDLVLDNDYFLAIQTCIRKRLGVIEINTGLGFGAVVLNPVVKALLDDYQNVRFKLPDGTYNIMPCPTRNSRVIKRLGWHGRNDTVQLNGGTIYSSEYFCPKDFIRKTMAITDKTIAIHHFSASWLNHK